jgi:hypothetical protein
MRQVLFLSSQYNYYRDINWKKLAIEIEQFQNQHMERASKYDNLKKSIKHKIEVTYNWTHQKQLIHVLKLLLYIIECDKYFLFCGSLFVIINL